MISEFSSEINRLINNGSIKDEELFSPSLDVAVVLQNILGISKTDYYIGRDFEISDEDYIRAKTALNQLKSLRPVQYITGKCEFMSLEFNVNENVLIPRPDTEILVEYVLNKYNNLSKSDKVRILDIGTGSGCIAVSLAYYIKNAEVAAIDISGDALETAKSNAEKYNLTDRVTFLKQDILSGFTPDLCNFDCIVSNPPYIETLTIPKLEGRVKNYEPHAALDGGNDGLKFYRAIVDSCKLNPTGFIILEIGYNQGRAVFELLNSSNKFKEIKILKDLNGLDRCVVGLSYNEGENIS